MPTIKAKKRGTVASSRPTLTSTTVKRTRVVRPEARAAANSGEIGRERVTERAYFHWLKRGCPEGSPQEDWFRADRELFTENRTSR